MQYFRFGMENMNFFGELHGVSLGNRYMHIARETEKSKLRTGYVHSSYLFFFLLNDPLLKSVGGSGT